MPQPSDLRVVVPKQQLGRDGPLIPVLGLGLMGLSCECSLWSSMVLYVWLTSFQHSMEHRPQTTSD